MKYPHISKIHTLFFKLRILKIKDTFNMPLGKRYLIVFNKYNPFFILFFIGYIIYNIIKITLEAKEFKFYYYEQNH